MEAESRTWESIVISPKLNPSLLVRDVGRRIRDIPGEQRVSQQSRFSQTIT